MARESKNAKSAQGPIKLDWTLALQLLDTTWRVAIPIILFTFVGNKLDKGLGTGPLFILVGLFLSLAVASLLVYRQIQVAYPDFFKQMKKGDQ